MCIGSRKTLVTWVLIIATFLLANTFPSAQTPPDENTPGGPYSGRVTGIYPHPSEAEVVYCSCWHCGVFKSENSGKSWSKCPLPKIGHGDVLRMAFHPANPNILFVGDFHGNIFRSDDAGASWRTLFHNRGKRDLMYVRGIEFHMGDTFQLILGTNGGVYSLSPDGGTPARLFSIRFIRALHVEPDTGVILFISYGFGLFKSALDRDQQYKISDASLPMKMGISLLAERDCLYLGTDADGIFRRPASTGRWAQITFGEFAKSEVNGMALAPSDKGVRLWAATTNKGVITETSEGNWKQANEGLPLQNCTAIATLNNGETLLVGTDGFGTFRRDRGSDRWEPSHEGLVNFPVPAQETH